MVAKIIPINDLYNLYIPNLGVEGAETVVNESIVASGLNMKKEYTVEEALKICEILKGKGGFIKIIARLFTVRVKVK